MPADFKLTDVLHEAFGPHLPDADGPHEILVEFAADKAAYVTSRTWHESQRIEVMPEGSVRVSLRLPALGPVHSWVLEWGAAARDSRRTSSWTRSPTKLNAQPLAIPAPSRS
jgi:hypothetical protein